MSSVIKSIPTSWRITTLDHICEILDFKRIPINSKERNERIANKKSNELYPYYGATGEVGTIDGFLFEGEHLLLGEDGAPFFDHTKDTAYIVSGKFWVNNHAHILKAFISNKYLCHYLNQFDFTESVTGTTRLKLNQASLKEIPIRFAPENEQHRIVAKIEELFSELDKGVESLKQAREQLKVYRQALLKHAFEGKLTEQWRKENADKLETADQLLERIKHEREARYQQQLEEWKAAIEQWEKDGKVGKRPSKPSAYKLIEAQKNNYNISKNIPADWKEVSLGEIILDGPTNGYSPISGNDARGSFSLKLTATTSCKMILSEKTVKRLYETIPTESKYWLEPGDLLVQRANTIEYLGAAAIYDGEQQKYIYPDLMMRVRFGNNIITKFVWLYLNAHQARAFFQANATGIAGSMPKISGSILKSTPLPLPAEDEIRQIVEQLEAKLTIISSTEDELALQIQKSEALRQSILNKAFSGQLVPQDPNDEPASALLKRIAREKAEAAATAKKSRGVKKSQKI